MGKKNNQILANSWVLFCPFTLVLLICPLSASAQEWNINVPEIGEVSLSWFDWIATSTSHVNAAQHEDLIFSVLTNGYLNYQYREPDPEGTFLCWLSSKDDEQGELVYNISAIFIAHNGEKTLALMEARNTDLGWVVKIQPEILEMMGSE